MTRLSNDTFLRALRRQPTEHTPVWLMRQAGRYLPEYRATRERAGDFLTLCKTPELACEVTLQPLARFALDAAILFSDILTIPDAMGLGLSFVEGEGPRFQFPVRDEAAVDRLFVPDPTDQLRYVTDAVRTIKRALSGSVPLIGFAGSPWTLACYMVEGGPSADFRAIKSMLYQRPDLLHRILRINARAVGDYLVAQAQAGADALMIFDSWGGALAHRAFNEFSLDYTAQVIARLKSDPASRDVPVVVFTKGGGPWLEAIAGSGCDAVGLDWTVDLGEVRARIGQRCALQGNLDPMVLMASPEVVAREVAATLRSYGAPSAGEGYVFNLGHGISRFTDPEAVSALVAAVHNHQWLSTGAPTPAAG